MPRSKRLWWMAGGAVIALVVAALALPAGSIAESHEPPKANHYKCYQVLDWTDFEPRKVELKDQFGGSIAAVMEPYQLCNPVDKNGEGIADKEAHLVCYRIEDDPQGPTPRVKEVTVRNQFQEGPLWVGSSNILCVPSYKSYKPRG